MKVRALRLGYYDHKRRKEGMIFDLKDPKHFSDKWMEKLEGKKVKASKPKPVQKEEVADLNKDVI